MVTMTLPLSASARSGGSSDGFEFLGGGSDDEFAAGNSHRDYSLRDHQQDQQDQSKPFSSASATMTLSTKSNSAKKTIIDATMDFTINKLQFKRLGICGRIQEKLILQQAVKEMMIGSSSSSSPPPSQPFSTLKEEETTTATPSPTTGEKQLILVSGTSGTGKSALVMSSIQSLVADTLGGSFAMGKFDQCLGDSNTFAPSPQMSSSATTATATTTTPKVTPSMSFRRQKPFAAFREVCEGLARDILSHCNNSNTGSNKSNNSLETPTSTASPSVGGDDDAVEIFPESFFLKRLRNELEGEIGIQSLIELIQIFPPLDVLISANSNSINAMTKSEGEGRISLSRDDTTTSNISFKSLDECSMDNYNGEVDGNFGTANSEMRHRINYSFRVLIRILSSSSYLSPLVIVLDDLQWADTASLELLQGLLTDRDSTNLMIVGIYRSNEVDDAHLLSKSLQKIRDSINENPAATTTETVTSENSTTTTTTSTNTANTTNTATNTGSTAPENRLKIIEMEIGNLTVEDVHEMLQILLSTTDDESGARNYRLSSNPSKRGHRNDNIEDKHDNESQNQEMAGSTSTGTGTSNRIWELAEICHKKTNGNAFYLNHFITMLYNHQLLEYNFGIMEWRWNIRNIELFTNSTQNVVDVLKQEMTNTLSATERQLLKYASFLGSVFDEQTMYVLWKDYYYNHPRQQQQEQQQPMIPRTTNKNKKVTNETDSEQKLSIIDTTQNDAVENNDNIYNDDKNNNNADENDSIDDGDDDKRVRADLHSVLDSCEGAGFIASATGLDGISTYRWVHDKLEETAMDFLVPKGEYNSFSQHVAEVLYDQLTDVELEAILFVVVNRFNDGTTATTPSTTTDVDVDIHTKSSRSSTVVDNATTDRIQLARLNLRAAKKAVAYSSFESAAAYCERGISLLPTNPIDRWGQSQGNNKDGDDGDDDDNCNNVKMYQLSLDLFSLGAEVEGLLGNTDKMEKYCHEVLYQHHYHGQDERDKNNMTASSVGHRNKKNGLVRDKFRVYNVLMNNLANEYKFKEAADLCLDVLRQYGTTFPKNSAGRTIRLLYSIVKIKIGTKSRTEVEAQQLPLMNDPARIEQMGLLDKLATYLYFVDANLLPLAVFKLLYWTLDYGLSKFSPPSFTGAALILAGALGDFQCSAKYAEYSLLLLKQLHPAAAKDIRARTVLVAHCLSLHWTKPAASMLKPVLLGYEVGMQSGDVESAIYCIFFYIQFTFILGRNLSTIEQDCQVYLVQMKELKQGPATENTLMMLQMVQNLIGHSDGNTTKLCGKSFDEDECKKDAETNPFLLALLQSHQQIVRSFFGGHDDDDDTAAKLAYERGDSNQQVMPGAPLITIDAFHRTLSLLSKARQYKENGGKQSTSGIGSSSSSRNKTTAAKYVKVAKTTMTKIKSWIKQGNVNVRHYKSLLDAEYLAYVGQQVDVVKKSYVTAAILAGRGGFVHDAALINERYGRYLMSLHMKASKNTIDAEVFKEEATFRIQESIKLYQEWGANAKVELLDNEFSWILH